MRKAPSAAHWFGTDEIGRDVLSRVIWGTRASLLAGVVSVSIALALGVPLGLAGGLPRRPGRRADSRITDAMLACPFLILAIALAAFLGPSLTNAMIAIGITATPVFVRLTRGQVLAIKARITSRRRAPSAIRTCASRCATSCRTSCRRCIVQATLAIAAAVIAEASLSFLGLGQQPPAPVWGSMLNTAKNYIDNAPWMAVLARAVDLPPGVSFNLLGDGLRDALDPRQG